MTGCDTTEADRVIVSSEKDGIKEYISNTASSWGDCAHTQSVDL